MRTGVAKLLSIRHPQIVTADNATVRGDIKKLGKYSGVHINDDLTIINCYTQYNYAKRGRMVDYNKMKECFESVNKDFPHGQISMPRIGSGLDGGDWNVIEDIINTVFGDRSIFIYCTWE